MQCDVMLLLLLLIICSVWCAEAVGPRKCLVCEKGTDMMCYKNSTCLDTQSFCFQYIWKAPDETLTDPIVRERAWGCADSWDSCMANCAATNCTIPTCCNNDLASHDGTDYGNYTACVFGAASVPRGCEAMWLWVFITMFKLVNR